MKEFPAVCGAGVSDPLRKEPVKVITARIEPRTAPGFGIELDEEAVARYRIAE